MNDHAASRESSVRLRDVIPDDLPTFFEQQRDPEANRMAAFPARDREAFLEHWAKVLADEAVTKKTILFGADVAGNIGCFQQLGQPLVGYWIGRSYWGRGIATRALSQFLDDVRVRPLYARVAKHNVASIRVLQKCGFEVCGNELSTAHGMEVEELVFRLPAAEGE